VAVEIDNAAVDREMALQVRALSLRPHTLVAEGLIH
jgi:hypothetical protein